jgi:hypothetical protein
MSDGSLSAIGITTNEDDKSGVCEVLDLGTFFLASVDNVYSGTSLCSLILITKATGTVNCLSTEFPSNFKFDTNSYYKNTSVSPDQSTVFIHTSANVCTIPSSCVSEDSIYKINLTSSTPSLVPIYLNSTNISTSGIQGFLAISATDLFVYRMYPSSSSASQGDGSLRVMEWWLITDVSSIEAQVEKIDVKYDFHMNRNNNVNCVINNNSSGSSVLLGYYENLSSSRTRFWQINKPTSGDSLITPTQLNSSKNCYSTNPTVKNNNTFGLWTQWNTGQVSIISTTFQGVDTVTNAYLIGNTSGASNSWTGTLYFSSNYGVYGPTICSIASSGCSVPSSPTELKKFRINTDGTIGVISTLINQSAGLTVKSITSPASGDKMIVKALVNSTGKLRTLICDLSLSAGECSTLSEETYTDTNNLRYIYPL